MYESSKFALVRYKGPLNFRNTTEHKIQVTYRELCLRGEQLERKGAKPGRNMSCFYAEMIFKVSLLHESQH